MKNYLKSLLVCVFAAFLLAGTVEEAFAQPSQISAPAGTSRIPSDYVDATIPDDPVFIFCSPDANGDTVAGTLSVSGGFANSTYQWMLYNPDPAVMAFEPFGGVQTGASSVMSNLESGFYQVVITTNPGMPNQQKYCRRAHVYVNKTIVNFDPIAAGCQPFTITGAELDALNDFTIYDPPATPFMVDSTTIIKVCFWADHTFVSDLGFYLIAPNGNRVDLLPPVSAWDQGAQVTSLVIGDVLDCSPADWYTNCNSGNHVQNFCFSSASPYVAGNPTYTPCICDMPTPLTGTFASCEAWNDVYGNMASQGGWKVQIYDCTAADIGFLQKVVLTFTGQSECGTTTYEYNSGQINVTINDNSCTPATAATYTVPLKTTSNHTITNEVTAQWSSFPVPWNAAWGPQNYALNQAPNITPEPTQSTTFSLNVTDHLYDTLGNEITTINYPLYVPCGPVVSQYFNTLPTDATVLSYPQYICANDPPIQLIPLYFGGQWDSGPVFDPTTGVYPGDPSGSITNGGFFFPNQALLGDNTIWYAFGGVCSDQEFVIINVVDAPVVSNIVENCNTTNTQYTISFTIEGGNPGAYQVVNLATNLPFPGTIVGSTWTSTWVNSPSSYSILVTDNNDCNPAIINGFHNCYCTSDAGNMPAALVKLCASDQTSIQVLADAQGNPTYTLDGDDGFEYYLHTNPFGQLGTPIAHNTTGIFMFNPTTMTYGTTYYVSQVVGNNSGTSTNHIVNISDGCLSVSQGTPVKWYEFPLAYAGLNTVKCGKTIQLDADTALIGVGTWSCLTTTGIIYSPNFGDPKATITVPYFDTNQYGCLMNTNFIFRWTVKNGPCETFDDVQVTLKPKPIAFAGNDFSICGLECDLSAEWSSLCGPLGQSEGEWFGPGTISQPLSPTPHINVYNPGAYTWYWRESNDECWDDDYVTITFIEQPVVDANHNDSVCGNVYALNAISTMGVGWWSGPLNTSFSNPTSPQSNATIAFNGLSEVNATFTWTEQNAFCTAADNVAIVYSTTPNSAPGLDDWTCGTSYTFDADILGYEYAMGTWKTDFVTAIFDDKHAPDATVTLPNTGSFPGQPQTGTFGDSSYVALPFTWVMDNNRCTDQDTVLITFYQMPVANAGHDTSVCGKVYNMQGKYSIGSSKGKWTMVSGPSAQPPTWGNNTLPNSSVQVPLHGLYVFKWKEDNFHNQTCTTSDEVSIYFIEIPDVDAGPDKYICGNETNLEAVASTGNGQWLPTQAQINDIYDAHSPTHYGLTGTNDTVTYVWQEYNEYNGIQCVSYSEVNIVYMIVPNAQVFFTPGSSTDHVCGNTETNADNIIVGVQPGITGPNVSAYWVGNDATFFPNTFAKDPVSVTVGSYGVHAFNWVVENHVGDSVCPDTSITILVDFIEQPDANAGPTFDTACIDLVNSKLYHLQGTWTTSTGDSIAGKWITTSPNQVSFWYIDPTNPSSDTIVSDSLPNNWVMVNYINPITPVVYDLVWQEENYGTVNNGNPPDGCTDWDTTSVTFAPRPTGLLSAIYQPHCIGWPAKLKANVDPSELVDWDWSDINDGKIIHTVNGTLQDPDEGPIYVKWPDAEAGDIHLVRLITQNIFGCKSIAKGIEIKEPEKVPVDTLVEPAKCGEPNGEIQLVNLNPVNPQIYNWIDSLGNIYTNHTSAMQTGLITGDHFFSANARSLVLPNDSGYKCTDTFSVHVHDTGYIAALFQVALADTSGISPHTVNFINVSYITDSTYTTATNMHFVDLINLSIPTEEVDAEYEWRFYHIRFDSLPDFNSPAEIFPWEDPIEIDGETVFGEIDPSITFEEAGYYKIEMVSISSEGCRDTIVVGYIFTDAKSDIVAGVNVFTPNGDGLNDFLEFDTETLRSMRGQIFSRWGKLIYEWTWNVDDQTPDPGWWDGKLSNGQEAAPGVYFYVIEGVGLDDTVFTGKEYAKAFHLIREKK